MRLHFLEIMNIVIYADFILDENPHQTDNRRLYY